MEFKKTEGGLLLSGKTLGVLGWVLTTLNSKYTYLLLANNDTVKALSFNTEEEAKTALLKEGNNNGQK